MKTFLLVTRSLLLTAALATSASADTANHAVANETISTVHDEMITLPDVRRIKVGMTSSEVLASMRGKPDEALTAQIWVYWEFKGLKRPAGMKQPAMLVFFTGDRVSQIRYSEAALVRKTLAEHRSAASGATVATK